MKTTFTQAQKTAIAVAAFNRAKKLNPTRDEDLREVRALARQSSGVIPSGKNDAEALALFRKNQLNHPLMRTTYAMNVQAEMAEEASKAKPND